MVVCNIASLFRALGTVMQSREATQTIEIGKLGPKFNIHINDTFEIVKLVVNETINRSMAASLGGGIAQSYVFFLLEERLMLNQEKCQLSLPYGVNLCFDYYCMQNFVIRGALELIIINNIDFCLHEDEFSPFFK